jgi:multidrug efflux system membrane fusion protein
MGRLETALSGACRSLALAVAVSCGGGAKSQKPHVPVRVATATVQDVPYVVDGPGAVTPIQTVSIYAQVSGLVASVAFEEGSDVTAGQVLVEIEPGPYRAALQQAEAALARDTEQAAQATREAGRAEVLAKAAEIAVEAAEQKRSAAASLDATVAADRAAVAAAKLDLVHTTLRSPIDGRAGRLAVHVGDLVREEGDTPIVVINQLHPIAVEFHVPQAALGELLANVGAGLEVVATVPGGAPHEGKVSFVDNAVDAATGTVLVKAAFVNEDSGLWPGQFVQTRLVLRTDAGRTVVPDEAVSQGQNGAFVYVVSADGSARSTDVTVERVTDGLAVIASGVSPGDVVVTDGQLRLSAGAVVDVVAPNGQSPQ